VNLEKHSSQKNKFENEKERMKKKETSRKL